MVCYANIGMSCKCSIMYDICVIIHEASHVLVHMYIIDNTKTVCTARSDMWVYTRGNSTMMYITYTYYMYVVRVCMSCMSCMYVYTYIYGTCHVYYACTHVPGP